MASDDPKGGKLTLRQAVAGQFAQLEANPQLTMLPEDEGGPQSALALTPARRGPGRPEGSTNKRTAEFVDRYLRPRHRSPLQFMAETWSRPAAELAEELGCSVLEAFQEQRRAAEASLPYWEQKRPMPIELPNNLLTVVFEAPRAGPGGVQGVDFTVEMDASRLVEAAVEAAEKSEENQ